MSVPEQIKEILKAIQALTDFMNEIKSERQEPSDNEEAIAAKIIKEVKDDAAINTKLILDKISECPCNQEIIDAIGNQKGLEVVSPEGKGKEVSTQTWPVKYKFPNFSVGNKSLGESANPNSMQWPFTK